MGEATKLPARSRGAPARRRTRLLPAAGASAVAVAVALAVVLVAALTELAQQGARAQGVSNLDLVFVVDRSKSMAYPREAADCRNVIVASGTTFATKGSNCYQLFLLVAQSIVDAVLSQNPGMGWGNGLRVGLVTFWCTNGQSTPQYRVYTGDSILLSDAGMWSDALAKAGKDVPDGGTCPSGALELVYNAIAKTNGPAGQPTSRAFPWSAVVTMTDGVFYDGAASTRMYNAMRAMLCVKTFAVAVAYTRAGGGLLGFTPQQLALQQQLIAAASGTDSTGTSRAYILTKTNPVVNPWQQVFDLVASLSAALVQDSSITNAFCLQRQTWCGFITPVACQDSFEQRLCKWTGNPAIRCQALNSCLYSGKQASTQCRKDRFCRWGGICTPNLAALPPPPVDSSATCNPITTQLECTTAVDVNNARACYWFPVPGSSLPSCVSY